MLHYGVVLSEFPRRRRLSARHGRTVKRNLGTIQWNRCYRRRGRRLRTEPGAGVSKSVLFIRRQGRQPPSRLISHNFKDSRGKPPPVFCTKKRRGIAFVFQFQVAQYNPSAARPVKIKKGPPSRANPFSCKKLNTTDERQRRRGEKGKSRTGRRGEKGERRRGRMTGTLLLVFPQRLFPFYLFAPAFPTRRRRGRRRPWACRSSSRRGARPCARA
jgi:hypothetical protein